VSTFKEVQLVQAQHHGAELRKRATYAGGKFNIRTYHNRFSIHYWHLRVFSSDGFPYVISPAFSTLAFSAPPNTSTTSLNSKETNGVISSASADRLYPNSSRNLSTLSIEAVRVVHQLMLIGRLRKRVFTAIRQPENKTFLDRKLNCTAKLFTVKQFHCKHIICNEFRSLILKCI